MKVLYIANFRDGTGYSNAAINNVLAMDAAGIDVVIRNLYLNNRNLPLPDRLEKLENKDGRGADIIVQHTLPSFISRYCGMRNICCFYSETDSFCGTDWYYNLELMDAVWVSDKYQKEACEKGITTNPQYIVMPVPCDTNKYTQSYNKIYIPEIQNTFVFYFIGEWIRRKNLVALLKAFHTEFDIDEPVNLLIKTSIPGLSTNQVENEVGRYIHEIKTGLRLWPKEEQYKNEIVLPDFMPEDAIMRLHETCDCFVMPSYGEGWNLPSFDAMAMGKTPIVTSCTGMESFVDDTNGYLVNSRLEMCFGIQETVNGLYNARQRWHSIDIEDLRRNMRLAYSNEQTRLSKSENGINSVEKFSYEVIGQKIKEELCNLL